jgi:hypothetical protein
MAQDYLMRMIQQIASVLASILSQRKEGRPEEARQMLDETCMKNIALSLGTVKRMTPDSVTEHLKQGGANRHYRSVLLAELLIQDGELLEEQRESTQAMAAWLHAFCLLYDSFPVMSSEERDAYQPKLDQLAAKLAPLPPNPYVTDKLKAWGRTKTG